MISIFATRPDQLVAHGPGVPGARRLYGSSAGSRGETRPKGLGEPAVPPYATRPMPQCNMIYKLLYSTARPLSLCRHNVVRAHRALSTRRPKIAATICGAHSLVARKLAVAQFNQRKDSAPSAACPMHAQLTSNTAILMASRWSRRSRSLPRRQL